MKSLPKMNKRKTIHIKEYPKPSLGGTMVSDHDRELDREARDIHSLFVADQKAYRQSQQGSGRDWYSRSGEHERLPEDMTNEERNRLRVSMFPVQVGGEREELDPRYIHPSERRHEIPEERYPKTVPVWQEDVSLGGYGRGYGWWKYPPKFRD